RREIRCTGRASRQWRLSTGGTQTEGTEMVARRRGLAAVVLLWGHACAGAAPAAKALQGPPADEIRMGIASGSGAIDHSAWEALLSRNVDGRGGVDYPGLRSERPKLEAYLADLAGAKLPSLGRDQLLALFINAYNACTIRVVLDGSRDGTLPA